MIITWFYRASIAIETEDKGILFDPCIPQELPEAEKIEGFQTIFLTNENPGCIKDVPAFMNNDTEVYCSGAAAVELLNRGADGNCIHVLEPGDRKEFGDIAVTVFEGPEYMEYYSEGSGIAARFNNLLQHFRRESVRSTFVYLVETEGSSVLILPGETLPENKIYPKEPDLMILPYCGNQTGVMDLFRWLKPSKVLLHHWNAETAQSLKPDTKTLKILMKQSCPEIAVAKPSKTRSYAL